MGKYYRYTKDFLMFCDGFEIKDHKIYVTNNVRSKVLGKPIEIFVLVLNIYLIYY